MSTYQLAPRWGFDRLARPWEVPVPPTGNWNYGPAHDLTKTGPDTYRITLEVPGVDTSDLNVQVSGGDLMVSCHPCLTSADRRFLRREIRHSAFEWRYRLPAFVEVTRAELRNGLLSIELARELPAAFRPRTIEIVPANRQGLPAKAVGLFDRLIAKIKGALARR